MIVFYSSNQKIFNLYRLVQGKIQTERIVITDLFSRLSKISGTGTISDTLNMVSQQQWRNELKIKNHMLKVKNYMVRFG